MREPAVIVLPIHNGEKRLPMLVTRVLELADDVGRGMSIVILDDGSTDDTFESACELASTYPQVKVLRQPLQRGLGPALDRVRRSVEADQAIVYDGVSLINTTQLADMLRDGAGVVAQASTIADETAAAESRGSRRFAAVSQLNAALQRIHQPLTALRWLSLGDYKAPRRMSAAAPSRADPTPV